MAQELGDLSFDNLDGKDDMSLMKHSLEDEIERQMTNCSGGGSCPGRRYRGISRRDNLIKFSLLGWSQVVFRHNSSGIPCPMVEEVHGSS